MKSKKNKKNNLLMMVIGALIGAAAGFIMSSGGGKKLGGRYMLLFVAALIVWYFISIIIHESGHLVMGLLTGYKFVSFRIGSFTILRQNGKFVVRKYSIPGTAGQCLLTHDVVEKDEDIPYFWYHAGGGLFNLFTAGLYSLIFLNTTSIILYTIFKAATAISFFVGVLNLIPLKAVGLPNDGSHIMEQIRSLTVRRLTLNTLIINGRQYQGETLDSMPDSLFEGGDPNGSIIASGIEAVNATRDMERRDFESAKSRFKAILDNEKTVNLIRLESSCDLLCCLILTGASPKEIDELYADDLKKYIDVTCNTMIGRHRLMYVYYYIYKKDKINADKEYNLADVMSKDYLNPGEAKAEMALIEYIKENY
ncbi:M50 family metallopeptidase [Ruminococcus albus]|uniref:Peptidase family M50 n=1 Tax=Ruminococcus albus TaxID=1264 RepID=A0A1I1MM98_RUMAL|nr:M50 family metallopeptidase [Ruminococcus albus]SFC86587.1 hypothetical protein SAMN02910406_02536 [Ruminococcus albus]